MTVSCVALEPRQCPAQPVVVAIRGGSHFRNLGGALTVLSGTVLIWVVAAEENIKLARRQDAVIPPDRSSRGIAAKVLVHERGVQTMQQEVSFGVVSKLGCFIESTLELTAEGNVAALVDGEGGREVGGMAIGWQPVAGCRGWRCRLPWAQR